MPSATYIRFIRTSSGDQTTDDHVIIQRTGVRQYLLTYTNTDTDTDTPTIYTIRTDDNGVFRWFRSVIGLLEIDVEPFYRIQVDFPSAPSILINTLHIGDHYNTILNALELWLDDCEIVEEPPKTPPQRMQPIMPHAPIRPVARNHHLFFDLGHD